MLKKLLPILGGVALGVFGALVFEVLILPLLLAQPWINDYPLIKNLSRNVFNNPTQKIIIQEGDSLRVAIQQAAETVSILGPRGAKTGCGFALTADGLLVLDQAWLPLAAATSGDSLVINGQNVKMKVFSHDKSTGLVLVKLENKSLKTTSLLSLESLEVGEKVFVLKKAWLTRPATSSLVANHGELVLGADYENIINEGVVTRKSGLLETNIAVEKDFGASPVFNFKGDFVGLAKVNNRGYIEVIPADTIRRLSESK